MEVLLAPGLWKVINHPFSEETRRGRRLRGEQQGSLVDEGQNRIDSSLLCSGVVLCSGNNRGHTVKTTVMELIDARNWGFATWVGGGWTRRRVAAVAFRFVSHHLTKHGCLSLSDVVQQCEKIERSEWLGSKNGGIRAWSVFRASVPILTQNANTFAVFSTFFRQISFTWSSSFFLLFFLRWTNSTGNWLTKQSFYVLLPGKNQAVRLINRMLDSISFISWNLYLKELYTLSQITTFERSCISS